MIMNFKLRRCPTGLAVSVEEYYQLFIRHESIKPQIKRPFLTSDQQLLLDDRQK
jgi:hypothetical protein